MLWKGGTAYFVTVVSYTCNMFIKSTTGVNVIKLLMAVGYDFS
jgi:hypothetical protein